MPTTLLPLGPKINLLNGYLLATGRRDPLSFLLNASREYGDIVHFRIGGQSTYLLNHPDLVKDVLVNNYHKFLKGRGIERTNRIIGRGLVRSEGNFHSLQRSELTRCFTANELLVTAMSWLSVQRTFANIGKTDSLFRSETK